MYEAQPRSSYKVCDLSLLGSKFPISKMGVIRLAGLWEISQLLHFIIQWLAQITWLVRGRSKHKYRYLDSNANAQEKAMAPHSSTLAWKIPWTEKPGRLRFMGLLRVRHDWVTSLSLFTFTHWRRKWQPTPEFLPEEAQGWRSLVGCRLWGHTESNMTEAT